MIYIIILLCFACKKMISYFYMNKDLLVMLWSIDDLLPINFISIFSSIRQCNRHGQIGNKIKDNDYYLYEEI